jgi:hypothetical protein
MSDRFDVDLGQLPGIVRGLGDRARDVEDMQDDVRSLVSRVQGLNGGVASNIAQARRYVDNTRNGLFDLQKEVSARGQRLAQSEGYPELAAAIAEAAKPPPPSHWWDPIADVADKAWDVVSSNPMETVHTALDVVGFIPVVGEVADGLNALIYLGEGDFTNAAISAAALVPVVGSAATGARMVYRGARLVDGLHTAARTANGVDAIADGARVANGVADTARVADSPPSLTRMGVQRDTQSVQNVDWTNGFNPPTAGFDQGTYLRQVADKYGINLRGSGNDIDVVWDTTLDPGTQGVTRRIEGGLVFRVNPYEHSDEADLANTIAHELSHARDYQRGTHKPHGNRNSLPGEDSAYGAGNGLESWIRGQR